MARLICTGVAPYEQRFAAAREAAGLTKEEACVALGCSYGSICNWESGRTKPDAAVLARMRAAYSCTADELLGLG